jgi:FkbM family methyltransferase
MSFFCFLCVLKKNTKANWMRASLSQLKKDLKKKLGNVFNSNLKKAGLNWFKKRKLKYSSSGKVRHFNLNGRKIFYKNGLELLYSLKEIFIEEIYKLDLNITEPYIIDCGANIGLSILYLKKQFPKASIIAFEPDETNFGLLKKNTEDFPGLILQQKAVWKENNFVKFDASATLSSQIISNSDKNDTSSNEVESIRLKDFIDRPIDFLKIDIEGAEFEVLKDCADRLDMVKFMFIEYHGRFNQINELTEIFNLLNERHFQYYIKEASEVYHTPFFRKEKPESYDIQLNIFCFKN